MKWMNLVQISVVNIATSDSLLQGWLKSLYDNAISAVVDIFFTSGI